MLVVLFVARFALGFQFQSAGSVTPFLVADFGVNYVEIGSLVGLYMLPGLVVAVPGGFLGRRFGDKRIVLLGMACMILGGTIAGAATSYAAIAVGRLVSGTGAAFLFVLMTKMVADWFVDKDLFIGMSIFIIGWPVGIAAAQATQGLVARVYTWNAVFYLTSVLLLMAFVVMAWLYRPPPWRQEAAGASVRQLTGRELWLACIAGWIWMLLNGAYLVMLSFGPTLLLERGRSVAVAGLAVSLMSWVFMFSLPMGGYLATHFKAPNRVMVGGLAGTVLVGALIPFTSMPYATFALFGIAFALATPVIASLPAEVLRPENRGPGLGVYYLWYYAGSAFLPAVGGLFKDVVGSAAASVIFAAAMMLGCLLLLGVFRVEQTRLAGEAHPRL